jgi:hypothetical protein
MVSGLANSTAKKADVKRVEASQSDATGGVVVLVGVVIATFALLHVDNRKVIAEHSKLLWSEPKEVPKAAAKKVDKK